MKKTILSSILLLSSTTIFADTTMCFKEGHSSMSTIENVTLEGGACAGKYSIKDMKAKGWSVDDIKISQGSNGMNFIYILKDGKTVQPVYSSNFSGNSADMEARILEKIEKKKEEEKKAKELERKVSLQDDGEKIYTTKCQSCHGEKGELEAKGFSRPLNTLSQEDMRSSISGYLNGTYNRGMANIMQPISSTITFETLEKVSAYLDKVNK